MGMVFMVCTTSLPFSAKLTLMNKEQSYTTTTANLCASSAPVPLSRFFAFFAGKNFFPQSAKSVSSAVKNFPA